MKRTMVLAAITLGVLFASLLPTESVAQYTTSLGIRAGGTTGLTLKNFYAPSTAFEGILGFFGNGFSVTGLIEKHTPAFDVNGLMWYYGPGLHLAFYNRGYRDNTFRDSGFRENDALGFGINGIIGLEYRVPDNVPIVFSVDLKPFIEIDTDGNADFALDPGIGVKFIIK